MCKYCTGKRVLDGYCSCFNHSQQEQEFSGNI